MAAMAAEGRAAQQDIFLDTSLVIAATVEVHPSHEAAATFVDQAVGDGLSLCISGRAKGHYPTR